MHRAADASGRQPGHCLHVAARHRQWGRQIDRALQAAAGSFVIPPCHQWHPAPACPPGPQVHELIAFDELNRVHPLEDAFTLSWKAALRALCARGQLPHARCKGSTQGAALHSSGAPVAGAVSRLRRRGPILKEDLNY